jgi:hypothetical protein
LLRAIGLSLIKTCPSGGAVPRKKIFSAVVWWFVWGKTTIRDDSANATEEVTVQLNITNPKSFFTGKSHEI